MPEVEPSGGQRRAVEAVRHLGRRQGPDPGRDVHRRRPSAACAWACRWPEVRANSLSATPDQLRAPSRRWRRATSVRRRHRLVHGRPAAHGRVEAVVIEGQRHRYFVLGQAKVTDKVLGFDELMGPDAASSRRRSGERSKGDLKAPFVP